MTACLSLLCFMVFGPPALVLQADPATPVRTGGSSVQAFGRTHACMSWTDGCTICTGGAAAGCSTPGIACTAGPVVCTAPATP